MMQVNGYTLGARAEAAALKQAVQTPRPPMKINAMALAAATVKPPERADDPMAMDAKSIFAPYKPLPVNLPASIAMDACLPSVPGVMSWAVGSQFHEGMGFFGYPYLAELQQRAEYRHAAEIWAEHAVRKWIKIKGGTDAQRKAIEEEFVRLNVREVFRQWMLHDHIFGRGQIFLDFDDADDVAELATPLIEKPEKINKGRPLKRLTVVEPLWSSPGTYSTSNPLRHDFYRPQAWYVYGRTVHNSRFLTISSRPVSDMLKPAYSFGGQSLTQLMKPYVDNWLRTRQAVSDMINAYSVFVLKTDMSSLMNDGNGSDLYDRIDLFNRLRDNRGSMAIDKDQEELENIAVSLSGLSDLQSQAQEQLASVSRIPLSIYLQITPTGLNATSDGETRNFYADVHAYQDDYVRPHLQTVFSMAQLSVLGTIVPGMTFEFLPLWEMSEKDLAEVQKLEAETDVAYVTGGIVSADEARERISTDETSTYFGVDLGDPAPDPPGMEDDEENGGGNKSEK